jgi:hypothetical protein
MNIHINVDKIKAAASRDLNRVCEIRRTFLRRTSASPRGRRRHRTKITSRDDANNERNGVVAALTMTRDCQRWSEMRGMLMM